LLKRIIEKNGGKKYVIQAFRVYFFHAHDFLGNGVKVSSFISTPLLEMGYSVIPTTREVNLTGEEIVFSCDWIVNAEGLEEDHIALLTLIEDLGNFYGLQP